MALTNKQKQSRYRQRLYEAGFMPYLLYVKRKKQNESEELTISGFLRKLRKITATGWDKAELSKLYRLLLKVANGQKGVKRLIKKK